MDILIYLLLICSYIFLLTLKSKRSLHMLQSNLYNENNRYLIWVIKNKKELISIEYLNLLVLFIGIIVLYTYIDISYVLLFIICIINIVFSINLFNKQNSIKIKKPLVITKRIKRLIFTNNLLYLIPVIFIMIYHNNLRVVYIWSFIICFMTIINYFVVFISCIINMPVEKLVYLHYKRMAQNKLNSINGLKIIGITGSYGKTSSKNILNDILNIKYNALATPKNLNTYNGLIMTVNNHMDKFTEIFIAEMGAYVKGEIAGLCKLVKPKYGILTKIGTAHLESFGSEQNIIDGKFELIESLPEDGFGILNGDDPKQVNYKLKNKVKIIWVGIDNSDVDVRALNIKCSNKGTSFDVKFKDDEELYHFETRLLGKHNVYNILEAIACGKEFGIDIDSLIKAVKGVKTIEHRLELKKISNFYMIDDAYNSNPEGAKRALEVLSMMDGLKVVVTPGMIELGDREDELNKEFGKQISKVADYVVLIGEVKTKSIKEGLIESQFDKEKIIVFNDVRKAFPFISGLVNNNEVYALFENDLPDTYNE